MKLIKPNFKILGQLPGLEGIYQQIEKAGRICYKSSPKMEKVASIDLSSLPNGETVVTLPSFKEFPEEFKQKAKELNLKVTYHEISTSAKDFVDMLVHRGHLAMLEHGTVYLKSYRNYEYENNVDLVEYPSRLDKYTLNPYSRVKYVGNCVYVTTNLRVLQENNWLEDLKFLCEPTEYHEKRVTVHFITSIGIVRELLRHRKFSFANESTRYCSYNKDRFGNEIICICTPETNEFMVDSYIHSEKKYMELINNGAKPQEAREVLPLATKSELIMTGFISDWEHLFQQRTSFTAITGKPHPDMSALIDPLYKEFHK